MLSQMPCRGPDGERNLCVLLPDFQKLKLALRVHMYVFICLLFGIVEMKYMNRITKTLKKTLCI